MQTSSPLSARPGAIHIHFDSVNEAAGFPVGFIDKTFNVVADRFLAIADEFGFKYTISVVGRDLEQEVHRTRVREWSRSGHEIGNHSWSHHMDLGALPRCVIREEVAKAHEAIAEACGIPPKGFISPAWSSSRALREVLCEFDYEYDSSAFPSWLLIPLVSRVALAYRGTPKACRILNRRDYLSALFGRSRPHLHTAGPNRHLRILPLPTDPIRLGCWHTIGQVFGWKMHQKVLERSLRTNEAFYYVLHPADLMVFNDVPIGYETALPRLDGDLSDKIERVRSAVRLIVNSRRIVTMQELAAESVESKEKAADPPVGPRPRVSVSR